MRTFEEIVRALVERGLIVGRPRPRSARAQCPVHVGGPGTLTVFRGDVVTTVRCWSNGCSTEAVLRAIGLWRERFPSASSTTSSSSHFISDGWRTAALFPLLEHAPFVPAIEVNIGRTYQIERQSGRVVQTALSPLQLRVLTAVHGAFLRGGPNVCEPFKPKHPAGCYHHQPMIPIRIGVLAESLLGYTGSSQRREIRAALDALATVYGQWRVFRPSMTPAHHFGPMLEVGAWGPAADDALARFGLEGHPDLAVSLPEAVRLSLQRGHFQRVPPALIEGLTRSDVVAWVTLLCQLRVARLGYGESVTFRVSGRGTQIDGRQFGMARLTPQELFDTLSKAAIAGNGLQDDYRLSIAFGDAEGGWRKPPVLASVARREAAHVAVDGKYVAVNPKREGSRRSRAMTVRQVEKTPSRPARAGGVENERAGSVGAGFQRRAQGRVRYRVSAGSTFFGADAPRWSGPASHLPRLVLDSSLPAAEIATATASGSPPIDETRHDLPGLEGGSDFEDGEEVWSSP
jgi:hypothetical protein